MMKKGKKKKNFRFLLALLRYNFVFFFLHSWGDAETQSAEFPFAINQPFKIGIAICQNEFKIAVNGQKLLSLSYDSIVLEQGQSLWDILTGFKIKTAMDLNVQVTQVEHIQMGDSNCNGFENYSGFQTQQW